MSPEPICSSLRQSNKRHVRLFFSTFGLCLAMLSIPFSVSPASAQTSLTTLYNFSGVNGDGSHPIGDLIMDAQGVLYGVTHGSPGDKIYQLIPPAFAGGEWTKVNIYSGNAPGTVVHGNFTPLIFGQHGELYGVSLDCPSGYPSISTCVFQLSPPASPGGTWAMNILLYEYGWNFGDGRIIRTGKLAIDSHGNLYGITHRHQDDSYGTVYELSPSPGGGWTVQVIYNFVRNPPPNIGFFDPQDGLVIDEQGNLYGSTTRGHAVFQLAPPVTAGGSWTFSTVGGFVYAISSLTLAPSGWLYWVQNDGTGGRLSGSRATPDGGRASVEAPFVLQSSGQGLELVSDKNGVLYGTDMSAQVVYKAIPPSVSGGDWSYTTLYTFSGSDGSDPFGRLLLDGSGNLLGTTLTGGSGDRCHNYKPFLAGCGTVFELQ